MPGKLGTSLVLCVVSAAALSASELNLGPATSALRPADAKPARIPATPAGCENRYARPRLTEPAYRTSNTELVRAILDDSEG